MELILNIGTHSVHELFWNEVFRFCMRRIIAASLLSVTSNFHAQILLEIEFTLTDELKRVSNITLGVFIWKRIKTYFPK